MLFEEVGSGGRSTVCEGGAMREDSETVVRCPVRVTDGFMVGVRLRHGSALSPFLFGVVVTG